MTDASKPTPSEAVLHAASDWFRLGEQLSASRPRDLSLNRAYTEAQLRLRAAIKEYLHA